MFCSNCGNKLENTDEFCPYCGMNQRQENIQQRNVTTQKRKIPLYEKIGVVFGFCMFVFILNLILSDALSSDNKETLEKLKDFTVFENESSEKIEVYSFKYGDEWKLRYVDDGINVKIKEPKLTEIFCTVLGEEKTSSFDGTFFYLIHEGDLNMFFDPELDEEHIEAITYNLDSDEYEILADGKHYSVKKEFEDLLNENQFKEILKGDVDAFIDVLEKNGLKIKDIEDISCLDIRNMEWDTQEDINEDEKSQETRDINEESVDISTFKSKDKNELESYNIDEISEISTYAFPGGHMILGRIDESFTTSIYENGTGEVDGTVNFIPNVQGVMLGMDMEEAVKLVENRYEKKEDFGYEPTDLPKRQEVIFQNGETETLQLRCYEGDNKISQVLYTCNDNPLNSENFVSGEANINEAITSGDMNSIYGVYENDSGNQIGIYEYSGVSNYGSPFVAEIDVMSGMSMAEMYYVSDINSDVIQMLTTDETVVALITLSEGGLYVEWRGNKGIQEWYRKVG